MSREYNSLFLIREDQKKFDSSSVFTIKTTSDQTGDPGYDDGGRRTRLEYENDTGLSTTRVLGYQFDASDRMEVISTGIYPLAALSYEGPGLRESMISLFQFGTPNNKLQKLIAYDHLKRPTETDYRISWGANIVSYIEGWGDGSEDSGDTTKKYPVFNRKTFQRTPGTSSPSATTGSAG